MPKVIYANGKDSNMFYATSFSAHDPFFYIDNDFKKYIFLDARELGVFKDKNKNTDIEAISLEPFLEKVQKTKERTPVVGRLAELLFRRYGLGKKEIEVPTNFPLDIADFLRSRGIRLVPRVLFFPERTIKKQDEIEKVKESMKRLTKAFEFVEKVLVDSVINNNFIKYKGEVLTSEKLKIEIEKILLKNDLIDQEGMIVSTGDHSAIPHHPGEGPLRPHETIIVDIFPRHKRSGFHGDMTRTYIKGKADKELERMYQAVKETQEKAIASVKPGKTGKEIHDICVKSFLEFGYHANEKGFIHGTGHGLGIDIHEGPYLNKYSQDVLVEGQIFSIEPGLYYAGIGGIRIEDIVVVTKNGCENLTNYKKNFLIK